MPKRHILEWNIPVSFKFIQNLDFRRQTKRQKNEEKVGCGFKKFYPGLIYRCPIVSKLFSKEGKVRKWIMGYEQMLGLMDGGM